ncbi:MAG: co-chaperone GroES [Clostridia bacterium]|nr:co-chaperone GroES [Clostridia bacterium]
MKLRPLFDKVVVKEIEQQEESVSGIFLPTSAKEKQEMAVVVAVGQGGNVDGKQVDMVVKVGDKVLYSKYAGSEFTVDGQKVTIIRQSDVLAVVEE